MDKNKLSNKGLCGFFVLIALSGPVLSIVSIYYKMTSMPDLTWENVLLPTAIVWGVIMFSFGLIALISSQE